MAGRLAGARTGLAEGGVRLPRDRAGEGVRGEMGAGIAHSSRRRRGVGVCRQLASATTIATSTYRIEREGTGEGEERRGMAAELLGQREGGEAGKPTPAASRAWQGTGRVAATESCAGR